MIKPVVLLLFIKQMYSMKEDQRLQQINEILNVSSSTKSTVKKLDLLDMKNFLIEKLSSPFNVTISPPFYYQFPSNMKDIEKKRTVNQYNSVNLHEILLRPIFNELIPNYTVYRPSKIDLDSINTYIKTKQTEIIKRRNLFYSFKRDAREEFQKKLINSLSKNNGTEYIPISYFIKSFENETRSQLQSIYIIDIDYIIIIFKGEEEDNILIYFVFSMHLNDFIEVLHYYINTKHYSTLDVSEYNENTKEQLINTLLPIENIHISTKFTQNMKIIRKDLLYIDAYDISMYNLPKQPTTNNNNNNTNNIDSVNYMLLFASIDLWKKKFLNSNAKFITYGYINASEIKD
jgi:hypothetical protein